MTPNVPVPASLAHPDEFVAICPTCTGSKTFTTERARDLWLKHHAHDEGLS